MALDLTPGGLFHEVKKALNHRDRYLGESYYDAVNRYVGPGYRTGNPAEVDFDNHAYKWLSLFMPLLASGNPRVRTKTPRQGSAAALAKAVEFGVSRNFELQNLKRTVEQLATDWFFKWCVAITSPRPVMGMLEREDPPYRPVTKRLSLLDYLWDPVAIQHSEARWQAHRVIRDRDSLLREAEESPNRGWDKVAIEATSMKPDREKRGERLEDTYDRDEVEFWEVWVPEAVLDSAKTEGGRAFQPLPERGYHGTIYTVTRDMDAFLREPRPFWGPRDGPYTFSGYLTVPDRTVPLSPLAATAIQAEMFNSVWTAAIESIRRYKKGVAVTSSAAPDLAEKIREFEDQDVMALEGFEDIDKVVTEIEKGGLTEQHLTMLRTLQVNLEQASGLTEAAMGQATGAGTATEASIAQQSSGKRMGYMAEKFSTSVLKSIAQKEAWYLVMHPKAEISLGPEAEGVFIDPTTGEPIEYPVLQGGMKYADLLEDMDMEIEPVSTRFTSELLEAEIGAQQDAWIGTFAPMIPQMPWVEWDMILAKKAEAWRDPSWAKVINMNKANLVGMMTMQMNMQGIPPTTPPQPKLGSDIQPAPSLKASEKPSGFSRNARPQQNKAPREAGASRETHSMPSKVNL